MTHSMKNQSVSIPTLTDKEQKPWDYLNKCRKILLYKVLHLFTVKIEYGGLNENDHFKTQILEGANAI